MKDLRSKIRLPEWFTAGAVFVYYWIMSLYKLTQEPIWGDECMEFYCSVTTRGPIRGVTELSTMYERMAHIQQQPPLYNWIMCLWLKISEEPFWYRFSSVLMGFGAVLGAYFVVKKLYGRAAATLSVLVLSSMYHIQYYVKEASEYIMLLGFLFWTFYVYLLLLEKVTRKRIIAFVILCVANMYTHYGAIMIIVPMACQMLFFLWRSKEWKALKEAIISFGIAVVGAGIPLIFLFFVPQSNNTGSTFHTDNPIDFVGNNMLVDFFDSIMRILRWSMLDPDRDGARLATVLWLLVFGLIISGIVVCIFTKKKAVRYIISCSALTYVIYYFLTSYNFYAYGIFGNRYNYFLIPALFLTFICIIGEVVEFFASNKKAWLRSVLPILQVLILVVALAYTAYGTYRVHCHWDKRDERGVAAAWYEREEQELPTYVCYWSKFAFVYYMTHDERYDESLWDNMYCDLINRDTYWFTQTEWMDYLENEAYPEGIPEKFYLVAGDYNDEVVALQNIGYEMEPIYDGTAKLFLATAPSVQE